MSRCPVACARVAARLDRWLDGALEVTEAALDRGHMEACAACDGSRERRARMLADIRRTARVDARELAALWDGVAARLDDAHRTRTRRRLVRMPALVGAAAAVIALVLLQAVSGPSRPTLHPEDVVSVQQVIDALPAWSDLVRGVGSLSRGFS